MHKELGFGWENRWIWATNIGTWMHLGLGMIWSHVLDRTNNESFGSNNVLGFKQCVYGIYIRGFQQQVRETQQQMLGPKQPKCGDNLI